MAMNVLCVLSEESNDVIGKFVKTQGYAVVHVQSVAAAEKALASATFGFHIIGRTLEQPEDGVMLAQNLRGQGRLVLVVASTWEGVVYDLPVVLIHQWHGFKPFLSMTLKLESAFLRS